MEVLDMSHRHRELIDQLYSVPGVREFVQSLPVRLGRIILSRRLELGWSQEELAGRIRQVTGKDFGTEIVALVEGGTEVAINVYNAILQTLGMQSLEIKFSDI